MVPDQDRDTRAQRWRHPGTTGQIKKQIKKEFTLMGWYGNGMGSLGWLAPAWQAQRAALHGTQDIRK